MYLGCPLHRSDSGSRLFPYALCYAAVFPYALCYTAVFTYALCYAAVIPYALYYAAGWFSLRALLHCCLSSCALLRRWLIFLMRFVTQLSFLMRLVTQLAGFPYALCYAAVFINVEPTQWLAPVLPPKTLKHYNVTHSLCPLHPFGLGCSPLRRSTWKEAQAQQPQLHTANSIF